MNARTELVQRLHALPDCGVFAVTGGGAVLLADLLTVPGASATVLEARVPYAGGALAEFIGAAPGTGVQRADRVRHGDGGVSTRARAGAR